MGIASMLPSLLIGGLAGIIGILVVLFGTAFYLVETLTRPQRRSRFAHYTVSPFELDLPAENVFFPARTGNHVVNGWYVPAPGATSTIVVCPGYRTRKTQVLAIANALWKAGHNVLAFEYYGHGAPTGGRITLGYQEQRDFLGALDYARQRAPHTHLGVVAYSMGAAVAILCSAYAPEVEADSAFATHTSAVRYNVRRTLHLPLTAPLMWIADCLVWVGDHLLGWLRGYRFHQVEPVRAIARLSPRPILLIHGAQDTLVDPRDADVLFAAAREPKEQWVVPEAEHCGAYFEQRAAYIGRVLAFFARQFPTCESRLWNSEEVIQAGEFFEGSNAHA